VIFVVFWKTEINFLYHMFVGLLEFTALCVEIAPTFWRILSEHLQDEWAGQANTNQPTS
jgi:hypothetical protein